MANLDETTHSGRPKGPLSCPSNQDHGLRRCAGMGRDRRSPTKIARSRNRRRNLDARRSRRREHRRSHASPNAIAAARSRRFARFAECARVRRTSLRAIDEYPGRSPSPAHPLTPAGRVVALRAAQGRESGARRRFRGFPRPWPARRLRDGASPASGQGPNCTSPAPRTIRRHRQQVAASVVCRTSDSVAPKGDSMQRKSVPLLIKGADDDSRHLHRFGLGLRQPRPRR